jgi:serine/threonine protein kinase
MKQESFISLQVKIFLKKEIMLNGALEKKLKQLSLSQKYNILIDICSGMEYLHSKDIIHRDLKTANILLSEKYEGKITDFGISKQLNSSVNMTQSQKGTPIYQAPGILIFNKLEQFPQINTNYIVGKPSDVYCFGGIIYGNFLLTN